MICVWQIAGFWIFLQDLEARLSADRVWNLIKPTKNPVRLGQADFQVSFYSNSLNLQFVIHLVGLEYPWYVIAVLFLQMKATRKDRSLFPGTYLASASPIHFCSMIMPNG